VSTLWRRPTEFFPTRDQSPEERVNAVVRFVMYSAVAIAIFGRADPAKAVGFGLLVAVVITMLGSSDDSSQRPKKRGGAAASAAAKPASAGRRTMACRAPTRDNPFMHTPVTEFGAPGLRACRFKDVAGEVQDKFETGLVREVTDVYHNRASDRQFVPVPVPDNIPDTLAFRNFLYSTTAANRGFQPRTVSS
jgi:hypothetical protein